MAKNLYIFDCFGVIISDVSTLFMNKYGFTAEQVDFMRKKVYRRVDVGEIENSDMLDTISTKFGFDRAAVEKDWTAFEAVLPDTVELLKQLKQSGQTVALLSNASRKYVDYLFEKFHLFKYFDMLFVSSDYFCAKPDLEFYQACVNSLTEQYDNIYFTDDNPANLQGLEVLGITPVLFTSAQDFRKKVGLK